MATGPNGSSSSSSKPPTAAAAAPGPGADTPDLTSLSGSGLYGDAVAGGGMGGVQGMLCADARGLCVQGACRMYLWPRVCDNINAAG